MAEFMSLWDGLLSEKDMKKVLIIAATNRPWNIDPAIQRRLSTKILFSLPTYKQRISILKVILKKKKLDPKMIFEHIATMTDRYSGNIIITDGDRHIHI